MSEEAKTEAVAIADGSTDVASPAAASAQGAETETTGDATQPKSISARICAAFSTVILVGGFLHAFSLDSYLFGNPIAAFIAVVVGLFVIALFFEKSRKIACAVALGGSAIATVGGLVCLSAYSWYVFFTTGMDISGEMTVALSQSGGAFMVGGIVMLTFCLVFHADDDFSRDTVVFKTLFSITISAFVAGAVMFFACLFTQARINNEMRVQVEAELAKQEEVWEACIIRTNTNPCKVPTRETAFEAVKALQSAK